MIKRVLLGIGVLCSALGVFAQSKTPSCGTDQHNQELKAKQASKDAEAQFNAGWNAYKKSESYNQSMSKKARKNGAPKYIIPVVVHIFYGAKNGADNISDAQVQSEIDFLNKSFRDLNSDRGNRRFGVFNGDSFDFREVAGDAEIEFRLARKDPNGNCTNGIVRVQSDNFDKGNDNLKRTSVWDTKRYFNIWVVKTIDKGPGLAVAGYAQFPFYSGGEWSALTDGIMVIHNEFGNVGTSSPGQTPNVTTTTHEAGHWLGLYHPFQSQDSCEAKGDEIDDTPPTYFAPSTTEALRNRCAIPDFNSCSNDKYAIVVYDTVVKKFTRDSVEYDSTVYVPRDSLRPWDRPDMQEAFMDYFIGSCASNMFTKQQIARMHYCLEAYRGKMISYNNLVFTGVLDPVSACAPVPAFGILINNNSTYERQVCVGTTMNFNDLSYNGTPTSWSWNFGDGATPATSNVQNPTGVVYSTPGYKTITLTVTNAQGTNTKTFTNAILVNQTSPLTYPAFTPDIPEIADGWELLGNSAAQWQYTSLGVYDGYRGVKLRGLGPNSDMYGKSYAIISPPYNLSAATNPYFSFWYAFAQNITSGTITSTNDELSVQYTTNCGLTWSNLRAVVSGANLATTPSVLSPTVDFVPVNTSHWKQVSVLSSGIPKQPNVRFRILFGYQGGNNLYIDGLQMGLKTGLNELTAKDINLSVYPNPFTTSTNINYVLPKSAQTVVEVYDLMGRKVADLFEGKQPEGEQSISFDRNQYGLISGMYFVKIKIENGSITQKVMVN